MAEHRKIESLMTPLERVARVAVQGLNEARAAQTSPSGAVSFDNADGTRTVVGNVANGLDNPSFTIATHVGDVTPPGVPTGITATSRSGVVVVEWDGTLSGGIPDDFYCVRVYLDGSFLGALTEAGSVASATLESGSTHSVTATAEDDCCLPDGTPAHNVSEPTAAIAVTVDDDAAAVAEAVREAREVADAAKEEADAHEAIIPVIQKDIADFKDEVEADYYTKTDVDDKTGAITSEMRASYRDSIARNLGPFYAHDFQDVRNATTNPNGYWYSTPNRATQLTDGWAHIVMDNSSGTGTMYAYVRPAPDAVPAVEGTLLVEVRNLVADVTTVEGHKLWWNPNSAHDARQVYGSGTQFWTEDGAKYFPISTTGSTTATMWGNMWFGINKGHKAEFDARVSFYEGTYDGPFKPYVTGQDELDRTYVETAKYTVDQTGVTARLDANYTAIETVSGDLEDYKDEANAAIAGLQSQVDGQIEAWYYSVEPTTSNPPAKDWTTEELRERHRGDIYYDVTTGHSWRWMLDGSTWQWQAIPDSDAAAALAEAQKALGTANEKRRIFTSTPVAPYDVNDLWLRSYTETIDVGGTPETSTGQELWYATQLRTGDGTASGSYHEGDWQRWIRRTVDYSQYANYEFKTDHALSQLGDSLETTQGDVTAVTERVSTVEQDAASWKAEVRRDYSTKEATADAIAAIQVGGRNLITLANTVNGSTNGTTGEIVGSNATYMERCTSDLIPCSPGETHILQVWGDAGTGEFHPILHYFDSSGSQIAAKVVKATSSDYAIVALEAPEGAASLRARWRTYGNGRAKLERGTKPTDYTAAPEDLAARPNLMPYGSHDLTDVYNATTNPDGYWRTTVSSRFTRLSDGWIHFERDNTSGTAAADDTTLRPIAIPDVGPGEVITVMIETRNVTATGNPVAYVQQLANAQVWGTGVRNSNLSNISSLYANDGDTVKRFVVVTDSAHKTGDYLEAFRINFRLGAGSAWSLDFRVSAYRGGYGGGYVAYGVEEAAIAKRFATRSQLEVTADGIRSDVSATYQTKAGMTDYYTASEVDQKADSITSTVMARVDDVQALGENVLLNVTAPEIKGQSMPASHDYDGTWYGTGGNNAAPVSVVDVADSPQPMVTRAFHIDNSAYAGNRDAAQVLPSNVLAGETYTFTAWARGVGGSVTAQVRLWNWGAPTGSKFGKTLTVGTDWQRVTVQVVPTADASQMGFLMGIAGKGVIEWLAPVLVQGDTAYVTESTFTQTTEGMDGRIKVARAMGGWYGTCSTAAATAAKVVTVDGLTELVDGTQITVRCSTASTASAPTVNVNGLGARAVWHAGAVTATSNALRWGAGAEVTLLYDGTKFVTVDQPRSYAVACSTAAATAAKAATVPGFVLCKGATVAVQMTNANTANNTTLNVSATGAYEIYLNGARQTTANAADTTWAAGGNVTFAFDGRYWRMGEGSAIAKANAERTLRETLIRQYADGVLACRVGETVGALVNASGSFDVVGVTWNGNEPTVGSALASLGESLVSLLSGAGRMYVDTATNNAFTVEGGNAALLATDGSVYLRANDRDDAEVARLELVDDRINAFLVRGEGEAYKESRLKYSLDYGLSVDGLTISPVTLYSSSAGTNGDVWLSKTAANFERLVVYYAYSDANTGISSSVEVWDPDGRQVDLQLTFKATSSVTQLAHKTFQISGTSMAVNGNGITNFDVGSGKTYYSDLTANDIYVYKVIGYPKDPYA